MRVTVLNPLKSITNGHRFRLVSKFLLVVLFFFNSVLCPFQDYFSSSETGQSVGGAKTGDDLERDVKLKKKLSLRMRKQKHGICEYKGADQQISAFVFATRIVEFPFYLYPKF